jgi:hypothetical protein
LAFHVHITHADESYLNNLPLSPEAKRRVWYFVETQLAELPDDFRLDPANRLAPDQPFFRIRHLIKDIHGDGKIHTIDFYVQDDKAEFGVLLVVFVDHQ